MLRLRRRCRRLLLLLLLLALLRLRRRRRLLLLLLLQDAAVKTLHGLQPPTPTSFAVAVDSERRKELRQLYDLFLEPTFAVQPDDVSDLSAFPSLLLQLWLVQLLSPPHLVSLLLIAEGGSHQRRSDQHLHLPSIVYHGERAVSRSAFCCAIPLPFACVSGWCLE